jgi:hypothetical protein
MRTIDWAALLAALASLLGAVNNGWAFAALIVVVGVWLYVRPKDS